MRLPEPLRTATIMLDDPGEHGDANTALLALTLFTVWAARTGRVLRPVPISELTARELEDFWADDQLEEPYAAPLPRQGTTK